MNFISIFQFFRFSIIHFLNCRILGYVEILSGIRIWLHSGGFRFWFHAKWDDKITLHQYVVLIVEEIKPEKYWWKKISQPEVSDMKSSEKRGRESDFLDHEPFHKKGKCHVDVRRYCCVCGVKTQVGCSGCDEFVCFERCWKKHHSEVM